MWLAILMASPQMSVASSIIREEGFFAMYRGLSAGLFRQATYTTARLGAYRTLSDYAIQYNNGKVCLARLF